VADGPVSGAEEQRMGWDEEQQPATGGQQLAESPEGTLIVGDVLQHVEADDGIHGLGQGDLRRLGREHLDVRHSREALLQSPRKLRIGLRRDDPVPPGSGESGERSDSCAGVENRAAQVRTAALEQPRVVIVGGGHPAEGLVLPGWRRDV
jgi:hypothetical protein